MLRVNEKGKIFQRLRSCFNYFNNLGSKLEGVLFCYWNHQGFPDISKLWYFFCLIDIDTIRSIDIRFLCNKVTAAICGYYWERFTNIPVTSYCKYNFSLDLSVVVVVVERGCVPHVCVLQF